MSTATRYPADFGYAGLTMSADEYLALGETPDRYELVHGVVLMSPSPLSDHNEIAAELIFQLKLFARRSGAIRLFPENDVRFEDATVYQPDISVYRADRVSGVRPRLTIPPDLIVEILSEGTKALDLVTKRRDYERFGVGEYWVVDPVSGEVRGWRRTGTRFEDIAVEGDSLTSAAISGFTLDLRPLRSIARGEA
jgi:Uma2 family endonuclease